MRYLILILFLSSMVSLSAQEVTTFTEEIPASATSVVAISIDSTNVLIKYWDADYILVDTELAYEKEVRSKVFETAPVYTFGVEEFEEDNKTILVREKEIEGVEEMYGAIGQFHTLYLPYSVESVEWVVNIPSSL